MNLNRRYFNIVGFIKFYFLKYFKVKTAIFNTAIGKMYLDIQNDGISKSYAYWGIREQDKHSIIKENLSDGDYVIDCGSNIGGYSKFISNIIGKSGKIICIEPDKRNHFVLKKNFHELECKKDLYYAAMSSENSTAYIKKNEKTNLSKIENINVSDKNYELVDTINFEYLISKMDSKEFEKFKLIRMDIEGHEVEVLDDLSNYINLFNNLDILFEVHSEYYENEKFEKILKKYENTHTFSTIISAGNIDTSLISKRNLKSEKTINSDGYKRNIYKNIKFNTGIDLTLHKPRLLRYVYLKKIQ